MTNRTRNLSILAIVAVLLAAAIGIILTKSTKLGLDLEGGIELVYQGQPTPQVPVVTQQALDDALETIRKRTDALGVSEPEIQRSGKDQISIGLPDVQNSERAIQQVGSTAQLPDVMIGIRVRGRAEQLARKPEDALGLVALHQVMHDFLEVGQHLDLGQGVRSFSHGAQSGGCDGCGPAQDNLNPVALVRQTAHRSRTNEDFTSADTNRTFCR